MQLIRAVLLLLGMAAAALAEKGLVSVRLDGTRERCFKEILPKDTVALFDYDISMWNPQTNSPAAVQDPNQQVLVTVREADGHVLTRKHSKATDRLFLTAATTGDHLICFQSLTHGYNPTAIPKLALEIFIGDAGDPHITPPITAQLNDLSYVVMRANELVGDVEREQALQRVLCHVAHGVYLGTGGAFPDNLKETQPRCHQVVPVASIDPSGYCRCTDGLPVPLLPGAQACLRRPPFPNLRSAQRQV